MTVGIKGQAPDGTFQVALQAARHTVVWLSRPNEDLRAVCDLAGNDMGAVVARGEELLASSNQRPNLNIFNAEFCQLD